MNKIIKIFGGVILLLIVVIFAIPFFFQDEIKDLLKDTANENISAKVDFKDLNINLFSSFPNLNITVDDFTIINIGNFDGDTLFQSKEISASVNLFSVLTGSEIKLNSINLESPRLIAFILEDGSENYNILKTDSVKGEVKNVDAGDNKKVNIEINSYSIKNGKVAFIDQSTGVIIAMNNFNHSGKGDFSQLKFDLQTNTSIEEFTVEYEGLKYLNKVSANLNMNMDVDLINNKIMLAENQLSLNQLKIKFDGLFGIDKDEIDIDLKFNSQSSNFKEILSLIPAIYKNDFNTIKTDGKMRIEGMVKGKLSGDKLPSYSLNIKVNDGELQYPDLPNPMKDINLAINITNPNGIVDDTKISIDPFSFNIKNEKINGKLIINKPESGPIIDTKLYGVIDLKDIKNTLNINNITRLEGIIHSSFEAKGNLSQMANKNKNINAKGKIQVADLFFQGTENDQLINILNSELQFNPKNVSLRKFTAKVGKSDLEATGTLRNLIGFVLNDETLIGSLNVKSNYFDFNPFLVDEKVDAGKSSSQDSIRAFEVPSNVNFNLSASIRKLLYDNLELENVKGKINVKNGKLSLENLKSNLLNGSLIADGTYEKNKYHDNPEINFNLIIKDFDIKQTYQNFISVKQIAPIAQYIEGKFSSTLSMNTKLDESLMPDWKTFYSKGLLNLKSAEVKNFKPFTTVGSLLNLHELSNPTLKEVTPKFEIKNGRFFVSPFKFSVGKYNLVLSGSNGLDKSINYKMEIEIPTTAVKEQANKAIGGLLGKDINAVKSNKVKVVANIGGTIEKPSVRTSASDVASTAVNQVTSAIVDEAKAKVDSVKVAAEKKLKEEAKKKEEELKKKLEEEAKKKLQNLLKWG